MVLLEGLVLLVVNEQTVELLVAGAATALAVLVAPPAPAVEEPTENAPTAAALDCVPLSAPPEVLIHTSLSVSGLCQKLGSTSMTTWYWFMSL